MRRSDWLPRTVVLAAGDAMIGIGALVFAALVRRSVPVPFTRDILLPEKFPLVPSNILPFAATLLIALFTSGFYSRSASPRHRPSLLVALPLQVALLSILSVSNEISLPRTLLVGAPLLEAVLLPLWRALIRAAWQQQPTRVTLIGSTKVVRAAAEGVRGGHVPGVTVAQIITTDGHLDDKSWAGTLQSDEGRAAVASAECAIDLTGSEELRLTILELCAPRPFLYAATLADAISSESALRTFGGAVLAEIRFVSPAGMFFKRVTDVVVGSLLALAALPVIAVAAAAIAVDSGFPLFVRQRRLGFRGTQYGMWKLRTMSRGNETLPPSLARDNDERVTRTGRWLRRYRIDELPQLLNVLSGDMSLVGPRPEIPEVSAKIEQELPGFHLRLLVKPGLAGLAQVESEYDQRPEVKLRYDLHYICTWSPLLDAELLVRSAIAALSGRGV